MVKCSHTELSGSCGQTISYYMGCGVPVKPSEEIILNKSRIAEKTLNANALRTVRINI